MEILINGTKINYEHHFVSKKSDNLVFIHGWMDTLEDSNSNYEELVRAKYNVLRFDLPGHGKSAHISKYSLEIYLDYIKKILKTLEIQNYSVIGHSMGAILSCMLFSERNNGIEKVVLLDPPLGTYPVIIKILLPVLQLIKKIGLLDFFVKKIQRSKLFHEKWSDIFIGKKDVDNLDARKVTIDGIEAVDYKAIVKGIFDTINNKMVAEPRFKNNNLYIIYGENDPVIDKDRAREIAFVENIFVIENQRHTPNRTASIIFNKILLKCISN